MDDLRIRSSRSDSSHKVEIERLAIELLRHDIRPPVVEAATNISTDRLRTWYKEIHNQSPPRGAMSSSSAILLCPKRFIETTLAFHIYLTLAGLKQAKHEVDYYALCNTIRLYRRKRAELNFPARNEAPANDIFVLARDFRSGLIELAACRCGAHYPTVPERELLSLFTGKLAPRQCPACHIEQYRSTMRE